MKARIILSVLLLTVYIQDTLSFNIQVDTIITSDGKKITFLSIHHGESSEGEKQTNCLIDSFRENKETHYHLLLEQASNIIKLFACEDRMLPHLDTRIQQTQPPLPNVTIENIEIRHLAGPALDILATNESFVTYKCCSTYTTDDGKKTIETITFQDVLDEFDHCKNSLSEYYLHHANQTVTNIYTQHIEGANNYYERLKHNLLHIPSIDAPVLAYAQEGLSQNNNILSNNISDTFSPLIDLHILKTILTNTTDNNLVVVAGRDHNKELLSMFSTLKATSLYNARNVVNGSEFPVLPSQITAGLLAEPSISLMSMCSTNMCSVQ